MTEIAENESLLASRFAVLATADRGDWLDVRRRARRMRLRRAALPVAALVAAIVVGSALALYKDTIDFWSSPPAPERIVIDFGKMRALGSIRLGANVIPGEARKITSVVIEGKPRALYVAPTSDGGFCWRWHYVGSCGRIRADQPSLGGGWLESEYGGAAQIHGHLLDSEIRRLELEYEDGERADIPFVWVTAPIDAGFYYFETPPEHLPVGHRAAVLRALDENGDEIARNEYPYSDPNWEDAPDGLPRIADRSQKRTLFDFRDHRGTRWSLVVAPAPGERLCYAYNFGGGCLSPTFPAIIGAMGVGGGNVVDVCCAVAEGVANVLLHYQDGTRTELEPVDGFLLYVIPPEQYELGHRLEQIAWLDDDGREIASRMMQPDRSGVYPCAKDEQIELGSGVTTCP